MNFNIEKFYIKYRHAFLAALLSLLFMYGFELTHFTISIDEDSFDNFKHTVELGRWGHAFLRLYFLPEPYIPFYTMMISILILSASACITSEYIFKNKLQSITFSILYASIPALSYQLQFQNQADTFSIAILIATCMAIISEKKSLMKSVLFVALGVFVISIYQTILLLPLAITLCKNLVDTESSKKTILTGMLDLARIFILMLLSYLAYHFITKEIQDILHIPQSSYFNNVISWGKVPTSDALRNVITYLWWRLSGNSHYGLGMYVICILPVILISYQSFKERSAYRLALVFIVYLYPFSLDVFTGSWLPARTLTQLPICFATLTTILLFRIGNAPAIVSSLIILSIGSSSSNKLFYADYVSNKQDDALSNQIIGSLLSRYPDFNAKINKVFIYGNDQIRNDWMPYNSENFGVSFFQYGDSRIINYYNMNSYLKLTTVDFGVILKNQKKIESLPCWPKNNSILKIDSNYIIKYCSKEF
ncbi:glucosyltransferase domain-containing protein [Pantoea brenneri]|uniref:glucosyltransferase domain-containing protein n=1 Tax=Pantoea brenneri TaxID=472694 RepID=UPI00132FA7ED|nr:glucosyltransferase domain-containing protein [Pantoea brenneri]